MTSVGTPQGVGEYLLQLTKDKQDRNGHRHPLYHPVSAGAQHGKQGVIDSNKT